MRVDFPSFFACFTRFLSKTNLKLISITGVEILDDDELICRSFYSNNIYSIIVSYEVIDDYIFFTLKIAGVPVVTLSLRNVGGVSFNKCLLFYIIQL